MTNTTNGPVTQPLAQTTVEKGIAVILRTLIIASAVSMIGRGIFLTLTVLYLTLFIGLSAAQVALILTLSAGVGVVASLASGYLADRVSARKVLFWIVIAEGLGLLGYLAITGFASALAVSIVVTGAHGASGSVRSAIVARAFTGESRVGTRAILRTVTNIGIAVGSGLAAIALVINTADTYRAFIVVAGLVFIASAFQLRGLPSRVDASRADLGKGSGHPAIDAKGVTEPARSPFRDGRYLGLTVLAGIFGIQFGLAEMGVPLWIVNNTDAPTTMVAIVLILNTTIVIIFQVPLAKGTQDVRYAGRVVSWAGLLMVAACLLYASAAGMPVGWAVVLLLLATLGHTFAEVLSSAGTWGLSFELADHSHNNARAGTYQGIFAMGSSLGIMLAPMVVTSTALTHGTQGWVLLGLIFVAAGYGIRAIARRSLQLDS